MFAILQDSKEKQSLCVIDESEMAFQQLKEYLGIVDRKARLRPNDRRKKTPPLFLGTSYCCTHRLAFEANSPTPDAFGRLLKWSIELSEFHISYRPRMTIKAQTRAISPDLDMEASEEQNQDDDLAK